MNCILTAVYKVDPFCVGNYKSLSREMEVEHYISGVKSLINTDSKIFIFCNDKEVPFRGENLFIQDIYKKNLDTSNIEFIPFNLETLVPQYNKLWERCKNLVLRNPEKLYCWNPPLAISRVYMMEKLFKEHNVSNIVWVDAALSNESYVPVSSGGTSHDFTLQNNDNYYPKNENDIFQPKLINRLFEVNEKFKNFIITLQSINQEPRHFLNELFDNVGYFSMTGGVIGMHKENFDNFLIEYNKALDLFIEKYEYIFTEIELFTYLNCIFDFAKFHFSNFSTASDSYEGSLFELLKERIYNDDSVCFNNTNV